MMMGNEESSAMDNNGVLGVDGFIAAYNGSSEPVSDEQSVELSMKNDGALPMLAQHEGDGAPNAPLLKVNEPCTRLSQVSEVSVKIETIEDRQVVGDTMMPEPDAQSAAMEAQDTQQVNNALQGDPSPDAIIADAQSPALQEEENQVNNSLSVDESPPPPIANALSTAVEVVPDGTQEVNNAFLGGKPPATVNAQSTAMQVTQNIQEINSPFIIGGKSPATASTQSATMQVEQDTTQQVNSSAFPSFTTLANAQSAGMQQVKPAFLFGQSPAITTHDQTMLQGTLQMNNNRFQPSPPIFANTQSMPVARPTPQVTNGFWLGKSPFANAQSTKVQAPQGTQPVIHDSGLGESPAIANDQSTEMQVAQEASNSLRAGTSRATKKPHRALVEEQILALIDKSKSKQIVLSELQQLFQTTYAIPIPYKHLGYKKMKNLLLALPMVSLCKPKKGLEYLCRKQKQQGKKRKLVAATGYGCVVCGALQKKWGQCFMHMKSCCPQQLTNENMQGLQQRCRLNHETCAVPRTSEAAPPMNSPPHVAGVALQQQQQQQIIDRTSDAKRQKINAPSSDQNKVHSSPIALDGGSTTNGLQSKDSRIRSAANALVSSNTHRRMLELLSKYPDGVTCSFLMVHTAGLADFLQSRTSKTTGKSYLSQVKFFCACEGVCHKVVDGCDLFFVDDKHLKDSPMPSNKESLGAEYNGSVTDASAAVDFVHLLENKFRTRPWPASKKTLAQFLTGLPRDVPCHFNHWLETRFAGEDTLRKNKLALKCIMVQLRDMGCLTGFKKQLGWNVSSILAQYQRVTPAGNTSGPSVKYNVMPAVGRASTMLIETPVGTKSGQLVENRVSLVAGRVTTILIDTVQQLERIKSLFPFNPQSFALSLEEDRVVAIDCEGVPGNLFLIQVGTLAKTYVFDCVKLGVSDVCAVLAPLLMDPLVTKLFHDLHNDAVAMEKIGGVELLRGTLDTQLAVEALTGELHVGFNQMLQQFGQPRHPLKHSMKHKMDDGRLFAQRPLPSDVLQYASLDVDLLMKARDSIFGALGSMTKCVLKASDTRARLAPSTGGARQICFDVANSYAMRSLELLQELRPDDMLIPLPLDVSDDSAVLLDLLPMDLRESLIGRTSRLSDIVLDKGRAPLAWINGQRCFLGEENRIVKPEDIGAAVEQLGGFGSDNRAGLEKQLHRVSAIRNRQLDVIGLTMRVGRHVNGNATIISDLLFSDCTKSILFLGEPGSGKTTVVREVARLLSERFNVCIVDTSNEIAGDGDIPHPCVGFARRLMVPSLDKQSSVMTECVQNHTPEVMVIDEIGRPTEVEAARTCKQRGVRLIASAHGSMRKLIKNPLLRGLIGGVETVTLGDAQAKLESKKAGKTANGIQKLKAQRAGSPTFDLIIELSRGAHHEWRVVMDAGDAVDRVLEGQEYLSQRRTRDPLTGGLTLQLKKA